MTDQNDIPPSDDPLADDPFGNDTPPQASPAANKRSFADRGAPISANAPTRAIVGVVSVVAFLGFVIYQLFSKDEPPVNDAQIKSASDMVGETTAPKDTLAPPPPPPPPPTTTETTNVPPPPPPPPAPTGVGTEIKLKEVDDQARQTRLKSQMMLMNNNVEEGANEKQKPKGPISDDPNLTFAQRVVEQSGADRAEATSIGHLDSTIAQGKVIDAVLETAINTDLPGTIRAIVSRDIYAEAGRGVLVPKGSRLIGTYNSNIRRGQKQLFVMWERIIRPDGIDIDVKSPGVDQLGHAGVAGVVDNKYMEIFGGALLSSTLTIALAYGADQLNPNPNVTTTTNNGTTQTTGNAMSSATTTALEQFGSTTDSVLRSIIDQKPTMTIDQGSRIKVFVNRDLIFPDSVLINSRYIQ